jgi:ubiquinone/menaquinone biosynthesis C-methylase UbiE
VHAVDISGEMVARARAALTAFPNAHVYQNNGSDLSVVPDRPFDFAFPSLVFQHVPKREVIYSYTHEVHRLLHPGALFKFQVFGGAQKCPWWMRVWKEYVPTSVDSWLGVPCSDEEAVALAELCGFEPRYRVGAEQAGVLALVFQSLVTAM